MLPSALCCYSVQSQISSLEFGTFLHFSGRFAASGFASKNFETEEILVMAAP
jgi:hypothetical protein